MAVPASLTVAEGPASLQSPRVQEVLGAILGGHSLGPSSDIVTF